MTRGANRDSQLSIGRLSYRASILFILASTACPTGDVAARQPLRHDRHGDRRARHDLRLQGHRNVCHTSWPAMVVGGSDRRYRRAARADDADAGARGAMHRLVGLAAVLIAVSAIHDPAAFQPARRRSRPATRSRCTSATFIGAITFSGSVIAFGKLSGKIRGAPVVLPGRHWLNLALAIAMIVLRRVLRHGGAGVAVDRRCSVMTVDRVPARRADDHRDRRRRHAGRDVDAEQLLGLGGGGHRLLLNNDRC